MTNSSAGWIVAIAIILLVIVFIYMSIMIVSSWSIDMLDYSLKQFHKHKGENVGKFDPSAPLSGWTWFLILLFIIVVAASIYFIVIRRPLISIAVLLAAIVFFWILTWFRVTYCIKDFHKHSAEFVKNIEDHHESDDFQVCKASKSVTFRVDGDSVRVTN